MLANGGIFQFGLDEKLIPSIVPDLNHAVLDSDRKCRGRFVGRCGQCLAGFDRETCTVTRADNLVIFDATAGQQTTVMGANIFDRIERIVQSEHRDTDTIYIDVYRLACWD